MTKPELYREVKGIKDILQDIVSKDGYTPHEGTNYDTKIMDALSNLEDAVVLLQEEIL